MTPACWVGTASRRTPEHREGLAVHKKSAVGPNGVKRNVGESGDETQCCKSGDRSRNQGDPPFRKSQSLRWKGRGGLPRPCDVCPERRLVTGRHEAAFRGPVPGRDVPLFRPPHQQVPYRGRTPDAATRGSETTGVQ